MPSFRTAPAAAGRRGHAEYDARPSAGKPFYAQKHHIRSGQQTIAVTVPRKPAPESTPRTC